MQVYDAAAETAKEELVKIAGQLELPVEDSKLPKVQVGLQVLTIILLTYLILIK